jgi:hypothetical protein
MGRQLVQLGPRSEDEDGQVGCKRWIINETSQVLGVPGR